MKQHIVIIPVLLGVVVALPAALDAGAQERLGVGVTTGRIEVDERLKPGEVYRLPPVGVRNTGDIPADYTVTITFHADQEELRPGAEWFEFSPSRLSLQPGGLGSIQPVLTLPVRTTPGEYFAYLEVSPVHTGEESGTRIGVAAATRLHFTVEPANMFQGMYYRALHLWNAYAPWTQVVLAMLSAALAVTVARRFFDFNIGIRKRNPHV